MVFCIIGLVIFGVMGIFSAKYRGYAGIVPFIRNKWRPVTNCWQFTMTGLKLES